MPVRVPNFLTSTHTSIHDVPQQFWDTLYSDPRRSNVILSRAEKAMTEGEDPTRKESWIIVYSSDSSPDKVDFILSCTQDEIHEYPIFIYSAHHSSLLDEDFLYPRLLLLSRALHAAVSVERVFSIFGPEPITQMFTDLWVELTGIPFVQVPYYAATFAVCTKNSHIDRSLTVHPSLKYDIRPAVESDIEDVAEMCFDFASLSAPFLLSKEGAKKEATVLVQNKQVWVHEIQQGDEPPELASIVCTTRPSATVSAITKVFTSEKWRGLRCAERLVRRVCKFLLKTKESVVLYVAHDNIAAAKVYHRVGFVGLDENDYTAEGVEDWLEIGFDRKYVQLGHW